MPGWRTASPHLLDRLGGRLGNSQHRRGLALGLVDLRLLLAFGARIAASRSPVAILICSGGAPSEARDQGALSRSAVICACIALRDFVGRRQNP